MPFHNGDFGGRQAVKGVNHLVKIYFIGQPPWASIASLIILIR
jgi:hypothetical protein